MQLVNIITEIQKQVRGTSIQLDLQDDAVQIAGPAGTRLLRLVPLYRPSSADVLAAAGPDTLLILKSATQRAAKAAASVNHILVPEGGYRIVVPGMALIHDRPVETENVRQVRLMGRTSVIAETLLLGRDRNWSVRELAEGSKVSPGLVHRALTRLEGEGLLKTEGRGPAKTRHVTNPRALAELWSQEEKAPTVALRGYLYGASLEALAKRLLDRYPEAAIGGTLAANLYKPTLTRVAPPLKLWMPTDFDADPLEEMGFQRTTEGANIEILQTPEDTWQVHRTTEGIARVSRWRAWQEIAKIEGRTEELATALLEELIGETNGSH